MRFDVRGDEADPDIVAVVGIDDTTINATGDTSRSTASTTRKVIRQLTRPARR